MLRQDRLAVSNDLFPTSSKTKEFAAKLKTLDAKRVLIIADEINENLYLASRNIPNVAIATAESVDPVTLVSADKVIASSTALKRIEERLS